MFLCLLTWYGQSMAQIPIDAGDPANPTDIPGFYKGTLKDIETEVSGIERGQVEVIATSPGGLPVYAVCFGQKQDPGTRANYNSAVGARDPSRYARKDNTTKPVIFFLGPVHGQEAEGIVGLVNLIHIAETGKDHRGRAWPRLRGMLDSCRVIIVPCGNPDGRKRCPYDSFVGLPTPVMTKYGQGTRKDGSSWGWPGAKGLHPMQGDVGILGAYFNDEGINMMHDDFFSPMARETEAILDIARKEAPDMTVSLHSHENKPLILQANYVSWYAKKQIDSLARQVNRRYRKEELPSVPEGWFGGPRKEDEESPPVASFNLVSALHQVSGTLSFVFECSHGSLPETSAVPIVNHSDILDIQLFLYEEMFDYALRHRVSW